MGYSQALLVNVNAAADQVVQFYVHARAVWLPGGDVEAVLVRCVVDDFHHEKLSHEAGIAGRIDDTSEHRSVVTQQIKAEYGAMELEVFARKVRCLLHFPEDVPQVIDAGFELQAHAVAIVVQDRALARGLMHGYSTNRRNGQNEHEARDDTRKTLCHNLHLLCFSVGKTGISFSLMRRICDQIGPKFQDDLRANIIIINLLQDQLFHIQRVSLPKTSSGS